MIEDFVSFSSDVARISVLNQHLRLLPNYSVLVDVRDRKGPQITYVVEENISIITDHEVINIM